MGFYVCACNHAALIIVVFAVLLNITIGAELESGVEIAKESRTNCGGNPNRTITLAGCKNNCVVMSDTSYTLEIQVALNLSKTYTAMAYNITAKRSNSLEEQIYRTVKTGIFSGNITIQDALYVSFSSEQFRNKSGLWTLQVTLTPNNTNNEFLLCENFPINIKFSSKTYNDSCTIGSDECAPLSCLPTSTDVGPTAKYSCQCNQGSAIWQGNKQNGSCKKIPGTLCSPYGPYSECITNAECKPLSGTDLYSCDCKTGYNITGNKRGCEGRGDGGGGASTLVVSLLGLQIITIFSIVSSVFKPMNLAL